MKISVSRKTQRQASIAAVSGIVVIGAATLLFKTYPHLNPFNYLCGSKTDNEEEETEKKESSSEDAIIDEESKENTDSVVIVKDANTEKTA